MYQLTTTTEDKPKSPTLTNFLPLPSGVQNVPNTDSRNNVEDIPKSVSSLSMLINRSFEDEFLDEGDEKCGRRGRQQQVEQRQEKAKKRLKLC